MERYVRSEPIPVPEISSGPAGVRARLRARIRRMDVRHLMSDRTPSGYSSIAPRRPDGTRGPIFGFNSNGWSR